MAGVTPPEENPGVSLRDYIEARFCALERAHKVSEETTLRAVQEANVANEKRFDSVNEFRGVLTDNVRSFVTRPEFEAKYDETRRMMETISARLAAIEDRGQGRSQLWVIIMGIMGVFALIASFIVGVLRGTK